MIPYGKQSISIDDIQAVLDVLESDWLTQGPKVPQFEEKIAQYSQVKYAIATNSATSALHIACLALGLGKDDYLWTVPNTFVASSNCALYCGAKVDFVDIDHNTFNMCVDALESKLEKARKNGVLPKIVIPVHFAGLSCDMQRIYRLSKKYGFKIIEDASHAIGAKYIDKPVGCCEYSSITVFSFHPVKIVTSGEGGVATTNSNELCEKMRLLRSHGITKDEDKFKNKSLGPWYYEQKLLGFNYRMTDIHAALGLSQFSKVDSFVEKRNQIARKYKEAFSEINIHVQKIPSHSYSSYHLFVIYVSEHTHKTIFNELREAGIGVNLHYMPVHLQPYYRALGFNIGQFSNAEAHGCRAITLPIYPELSDCDLNYTIKLVLSLYTKIERV